MTRDGAASGALTATGRVPVEHRLLGFDRRSLVPALVVLGLLLLWTVVVPAIDGAVDYRQQTRAGDVLALADGLTMDAQEGWSVDSGLLTTDRTASRRPGAAVLLTDGGVSFEVTPGPFRGTPRQLLADVERVDSAKSGGSAYHVSSPVAAFHTTQGAAGVAQAYSTVQGAGIVSALVYGSTGVRIVATGPAGWLGDRGEEVGAMIDSIRSTSGAPR